MVSAVLGGKTRLGRDRIMADMIASQIDKCATIRTAASIVENPDLEHVAEAIPVIQHEGEAAPNVEGVDDDSAENRTMPATEREIAKNEAPSDAVSGEAEPAPPPVMRPVPVQVPSRPETIKIATAEPSFRGRPAFVSGVPRPPERDMMATGSIRPSDKRVDGSTSRYIGAETATPSTLAHKPRRDRAEARENAKPIKVASLDPQSAVQTGRNGVHSWMVQIGATDSLAKANELIARAQGTSHGTLAGARPFTEKVQKGKETLFRARFSGLEAASAESACKNLKRGGLSCFATRN